MKPRILQLARQASPWASLRLPITQRPIFQTCQTLTNTRAFSATSASQNWLFPKRGHKVKSRKGRPRVKTGGSVKGTTIVWGDWGLRMMDHDRRVSAMQLQVGAETIKKRLRGMKYKLYTRVSANIGVYTSGNEVRMGKGKGSFDHWACRIPVSRIIFEIKGEMHEKVVRDALRLAAAKMPGQYEFVRRGDPPMVGLTKLTEDLTLEDLKLPKLETESSVSRVENIPNAS